jgi:hypothetical protein
MQENKLIKILVPIIAVVVIFESIMLVSSLEKQTQVSVSNSNVATESAEPSKSIETPVINLTFITTSTDIKVGKSYKVELDLMGNDNIFVDGIETYIKYNPELVTVSGLVSSDKLPKANLSKIDNENGVIKNIILIDDKAGYKIIKDQVNKILTFNVVPKKEGLIEFEISSSNTDKKFVTMIVETATSKVLNFSSSKLEINAIK